MKRKYKRRDIQSKIIQRQSKEIEKLKEIISKLKVDNQKQKEFLNSINNVQNILNETVYEIEKKKDRYDQLIKELVEMKKTINNKAFKGRWKLIRLLIK